MKIDLKGRSFLTLMDFTPEEIRYLLDLAHDLKAKKKSGIKGTALTGRNIVLLFEKTSTRTRCSFEVAALDEGGGATYLDPKSSQMGKKESIADTAKVLGRFYDGIEYRGYSQEVVEELAANAGVPVWNGLTDVDHPTQILADILTIEEHIDKPLSEVKVVFVGDIRNNMSYAWMYGCAKIIWASMGEEDQIPERVRLLSPFKVTEEMMAQTGNPDCLFMHCLPSFHDFRTTMAAEQMALGYDIREVTEEVFSGKNSVVFDEAENRLHSIKAVVVATIGDLS